MTDTLVDTNVILDVVGADPHWFDWSGRQLADCADRGRLILDQIIYAELAVGFAQPSDLDETLAPWPFQRDDLPFEAAFLAGMAYLRYRKRAGRAPRLCRTSSSVPMQRSVDFGC